MQTDQANIWGSVVSHSLVHKADDAAMIDPINPPVEALLVHGGNEMHGEITISGAKNAALPIMCAGLLTADPLNLSNMPVGLRDIKTLAAVITSLGAQVIIREDSHVTIQCHAITNPKASYELVRQMRASILVLGPILARNGEAVVSLPGGCAIGARPVDLHLKGLEAMGAEITVEDGYVHANAPLGGLNGADITFEKVSVGATENIMMAATLANGTTILRNAACEPEIIDLGHCLQAMGAQIDGLGSDIITITGVNSLHGTNHDVIPDRIETGTYMMAVGMTGGEIALKNTSLDNLGAVVDILRSTNMHIETLDNGDVLVRRNGMKIEAIDIETAPYPGFPTDLQAQMMALLCMANGTSRISERIFENRFMHVPELNRMGAKITVDGHTAIIEGVDHLNGAEVMATDLRASVAMVLAGMIAQGETVVHRIYHLKRGYDNIIGKLSNCGISIETLKPRND